MSPTSTAPTGLGPDAREISRCRCCAAGAAAIAGSPAQAGIHNSFMPKNVVTSHQPLAERLRPKTLGEVIGQQHLLGEGMPLRIAFESGQPHSCILWGPPGTG